MGINYNKGFPAQKKSTVYKQSKDNEWAKDCIKAAENIIMSDNSGIRQSMHNKYVNYNLYSDILDPKEVERVVNPAKLNTSTFPATMRNYPLGNPKIDLLVGEEYKRRFDYRLRVMNDDAISDIEQEKKEIIFKSLMESVKLKENKEEAGKRIDKLHAYINFEYQDLRERMATHILSYLYKNLNMKQMFNEGFKDALIAGEEIYCADIIAGEPIVRKVNPLNIYTIRSSNSQYIEDADIIVEVSYDSIGKIIDTYYEYLTESEIDELEGGGSHTTENKTGVVNYNGVFPLVTTDLFGDGDINDGMIEITPSSNINISQEGIYDEEGNIRVIRVVWKSLRKIGNLKYYDEDGNSREKLVDENYKPNKERGEEIEWLWVNEWWEGTKIGKDIFVKIQPRPIQFRRMENLSAAGSGYVGTIYGTNNNKAMSLMDRLKPTQYLYNTFMYRTDLAFAKNKGILGELDISKMPDGWELEDWLYYAEVLNWVVVDSFKESDDGKLAGNFNTQGGRVMNMEMGSYIQQHVEMLRFLEDQAGQISGITKQREGQISNRETVGGVERAVLQSSNITEPWFALHDNTKIRVMKVLLETAKYAYKNTNKKVNYILDDMSSAIFEIDGKQFNEAEYGIVMSNSSDDMILFQKMEQLAQAAIQNGNLTYGQLLTIYHSESLATIRRKIESAEQENIERKQKEQEKAMQSQENIAKMNAQDKEAERKLRDDMNKRDNQTKVLIAGIKAEQQGDLNTQDVKEDNTDTKLILDQEKLDLERDKILKGLDINFKKLEELKRSNLAKEKLKEKEIKLKATATKTNK